MADNKDTSKQTPDANTQEPAKEQPKWLVQIKKFFEILKVIFTKIKNSKIIVSTLGFIKKQGLMGWVKIIGSTLILCLGLFLFLNIPKMKNLWSSPFITNWNDVAQDSWVIDENETIKKYANDLLAPQYVVQLNKVVVNLKPSPSSTRTPMVAFDIYIRTDTEAASIEIKNREKQFQDQLQRFTESLSYDQILSEEGKMNWKLKMRKELNFILNSGRIRDIYFKNLIIKP